MHSGCTRDWRSHPQAHGPHKHVLQSPSHPERQWTGVRTGAGLVGGFHWDGCVCEWMGGGWWVASRAGSLARSACDRVCLEAQNLGCVLQGLLGLGKIRFLVAVGPGPGVPCASLGWPQASVPLPGEAPKASWVPHGKKGLGSPSWPLALWISGACRRLGTVT